MSTLLPRGCCTPVPSSSMAVLLMLNPTPEPKGFANAAKKAGFWRPLACTGGLVTVMLLSVLIRMWGAPHLLVLLLGRAWAWAAASRLSSAA